MKTDTNIHAEGQVIYFFIMIEEILHRWAHFSRATKRSMSFSSLQSDKGRTDSQHRVITERETAPGAPRNHIVFNILHLDAFPLFFFLITSYR